MTEASRRNFQRAKSAAEPIAARDLTPAELRQRQTAALKHGAYATERGLQLRNRRLRGHVTRLLKAHPSLSDKPRHLVRRYVELDSMAAQLWNLLYEGGPVNGDGAPKRLLSEYRYVIAELRALAGTLGLLSPTEDDPLGALLAGGGR